MDPMTAIISAIIAGATSALKPTAEQAVKDAYQGLKALINYKWEKLDISTIEAKPDSDARKAVLQEDLVDVGAQNDQELLSAAQNLLSVLSQKDPDALLSIGVKLENIDVKGNVRITDAHGDNAGVAINKATIGEDLDISGVTSGRACANPR